ncbi:MAG: hypothetical protein NTW25_03785 [Candidatus Kapabacteria bacterium]|nr:hypothetical protein [Candidatus Kapabacteria bacterium]
MTYEIKSKLIDYISITNLSFSGLLFTFFSYFKDSYLYHWISYLPIGGFQVLFAFLLLIFLLEIVSKFHFTNTTYYFLNLFNLIDIILFIFAIYCVYKNSIHYLMLLYILKTFLFILNLKIKEVIQFRNTFSRNIKKLLLALSMIVLLYISFTFVSKRLVFAYNPEFWVESNRIRTFTTYVISASQSTKTTVDYWKNQIELFQNKNNPNYKSTLEFLENNIYRFEIELLLLSNITFLLTWLVIIFTIISIVKTEMEEIRNKLKLDNQL